MQFSSRSSIENKPSSVNFFNPHTGNPLPTLTDSVGFKDTERPNVQILTALMPHDRTNGFIEANDRDWVKFLAHIPAQQTDISFRTDRAGSVGWVRSLPTGLAVTAAVPNASGTTVTYTMVGHTFVVGDIINIQNPTTYVVGGVTFHDTAFAGFQKVIAVNGNDVTTDFDANRNGVIGATNTVLANLIVFRVTFYRGRQRAEQRRGIVVKGQTNTIAGQPAPGIIVTPGSMFRVPGGRNPMRKAYRTSRFTTKRQWELADPRNPYLAKVRSVEVFEEHYGTDRAFNAFTNSIIFRDGSPTPIVVTENDLYKHRPPGQF
jgi:hypothetical protein